MPIYVPFKIHTLYGTNNGFLLMKQIIIYIYIQCEYIFLIIFNIKKIVEEKIFSFFLAFLFLHNNCTFVLLA